MTSQEEVAAYVATTCLALRTMAFDAELVFLAQILDMAGLEAENIQCAVQATVYPFPGQPQRG